MDAGLPGELGRLGPVTGQLAGNGLTSALIYSVPQDPAGALGWFGTYRDVLLAGLRTYGAILLRGLPVEPGFFAGVVEIIGGQLAAYTERSTPRTEIAPHVYTSTEYPADQAIPMHNENSYSDTWPATLFFLCQTPAESGGATPIADSRAVLRLIPGEVKERFADGVLYTRSFREGLGLSWQEAFQTTSRETVEVYCVRHNQEFEWIGDELRTRHIRPAWQREPHTGSQVWFNQANLFHVSSLDEEIREVLVAEYGLTGLPRNAYLRDGSPIPAADLDAISAAYDQASLILPYQQGDIFMIDNMLTAHGRQAYRGPRRVLVAMC
jgi:alpha-ketoglutarate-dependent taurine dioxygenase